MQAQIVHVGVQFEQLRDETDEERNIRLLMSISFTSPKPLDELMATPWYYQGQVEYVIGRDVGQREKPSNEALYVLHVVAFSADGHSPGYNDAVKRLIGPELYAVLQPEWQEVLLQLIPILGDDTIASREAVRQQTRQHRRVYQASFEDGAHILKLLLNFTEVTQS